MRGFTLQAWTSHSLFTHVDALVFPATCFPWSLNANCQFESLSSVYICLYVAWFPFGGSDYYLPLFSFLLSPFFPVLLSPRPPFITSARGMCLDSHAFPLRLSPCRGNQVKIWNGMTALQRDLTTHHWSCETFCTKRMWTRLKHRSYKSDSELLDETQSLSLNLCWTH